MASEPQVVALIPARGGSKSTPMKNIALLAGRPLIAHEVLLRHQSPGRHPASTPF